MAQYAVMQIVAATEWVDNLAIGRLRDGVDGEVATLEVFFECDVRIGVKSKAFVAFANFAFGAGECVFFAALWMNEYWILWANRLKAVAVWNGQARLKAAQTR